MSAAFDFALVNLAGIEETVTDKGYPSGAVVKRRKAYGVRRYIPEKRQRGGVQPTKLRILWGASPHAINYLYSGG